MLIKKLNLSVTKKSLIYRDSQGQALKGGQEKKVCSL